MSGHEITPAGVDPEDTSRQVIPEADDPFSVDDMPPALLEFHSPSAGLINMPPTASAQYITWLIGGFALAGLLGMSIFPLDRVVETEGRLVSTQPTLLVQAFDTAIIRSIDVHEGDFVRKGQVLAHLDPTISEADVESMHKQALSYQAQVDRLRAEADGKDYVPDMNNPASVQEAATFLKRKQEFDAKVAYYDGQVESSKSDLQGFLASVAMYAARASVLSDVHSMRMKLQQAQVGSKLSTLSAQNDLVEVERSQITAQQSAQSTRSKLDSQIGERNGFVENWKATIYSDLSEAQHHLYEAQGDYSKAVLHKSMVVLTADQDAIVLTIAKFSVGSVLTPGGKFISLVPVGSALEVEATMRGRDAGFVHLGDKALVKFATFPYDRYGGAEASVRTISADSFVPSDDDGTTQPSKSSSSNQDADDGGAFYKVRMSVDRYTLHGVPSFFHPQPGMPVTADINVGKRTIMQYLLSRLIPVATEGMREP